MTSVPDLLYNIKRYVLPTLVKGVVVALLPLLVACHDDEPAGPLPEITWAMSSGRFRCMVGETLMLVPDVENTDETTVFQWIVDGRPVGTGTSYTFIAEEVGEYFVGLTVNNRFGTVEDEAKITVTENTNAVLPDIPQSEGLRYPWTEINVAQGRTLKVVAYVMPTGKMLSTVFSAAEQGSFVVTLTDDEQKLSQDFTINVCPPAGTYRRASEGDVSINRVYEFMPAPGHQVNGYTIIPDRFPPNCSHEEACDSALSYLRAGKSISLGSQGGYIIAGFDHSVRNSGGDYDLAIKGNPFSYQSEAGIIWVSQDDNGDGLPNDQWFELAGSEYGTDNETLDYAITYYRPTQQRSAVGWRDCLGEEGYVPYMSYWNPKPYYWMDWMDADEWTYFGSRLRNRSTYIDGFSDIPPYDWGYVDNLSPVDFFVGTAGKMNYFKLSNARTWDGQPARLEYIDFVRVQTAQTGSTPNLGEISTEVYYIGETSPNPSNLGKP